MKFRRGLVVGKFCPLHRGHMLVIDTALAACEEVVIVSYTNPPFPHCASSERARWLHTLYPQVQALVLPETAPMPHNDADGDLHRQFTGELVWRTMGTPVDAVFTSEEYGEGFARYLERHFAAGPVRHVQVDRARAIVPVSGTAIRADPHAHRAFLDPRVYASFVERIAILGGESSGKTTLAGALAGCLGTVWAEEYGRERWVAQGGVLVYDDMLHIASTQAGREDGLAAHSARYLVCDTTPLTTAFYSDALFGRVDPRLALLAGRSYAHTFLCAPEFPFEQDGTRQDDVFRMRQHAWYLERLAGSGAPWTLLRGTVGARIAQALQVLG